MSKAKAKREEPPPRPYVESPTWAQLHRLATTVMDLLGGSAGAASKLNVESFLVLALLASLNLDDAKANAPIFGKRYLT